jgi:mannose-6-phosphate isomerase-like protein (cupin superfamily)
VLFVKPGGGAPVTRVNGEDTRLIAGDAETGGAYAARLNSAPANFNRVSLHVHRDADEAFFVVEGRLLVHIDGAWAEAPSGSFILVPRGAPHAIANAAGEAVRWLTLISPAEQAGWVEAEHDLLAESGGEPDPERLAAIHRRFGLELVGPPPPLPADARSQLPLR